MLVFLGITGTLNTLLSLLPWYSILHCTALPTVSCCSYSRCYANNYLHWGAGATWLLLTVETCYTTATSSEPRAWSVECRVQYCSLGSQVTILVHVGSPAVHSSGHYLG